MGGAAVGLALFGGQRAGVSLLAQVEAGGMAQHRSRDRAAGLGALSGPDLRDPIPIRPPAQSFRSRSYSTGADCLTDQQNIFSLL